jgi:hypothetical protein
VVDRIRIMSDADQNLRVHPDTGLVVQNPPNAGTLNTVGGLGVDITTVAGFDISGGTPLTSLTVLPPLL